jgi:hypothetical protein
VLEESATRDDGLTIGSEDECEFCSIKWIFCVLEVVKMPAGAFC